MELKNYFVSGHKLILNTEMAHDIAKNFVCLTPKLLVSYRSHFPGNQKLTSLENYNR